MMRQVLAAVSGLGLTLAVSSSEATIMVSKRQETILQMLARVASEQGVPYEHMVQGAKIESGLNPKKRTGKKYAGLYMLSTHEQKRNGGGNRLNPEDNARAFAKLYSRNAGMFEARTGRKPEFWEIYMMHQQGSGGAASHMGNPDAPAWKNMYRTAEGQEKGPGWSKQAIKGNIPKDVFRKRFGGDVNNVTSQDFMDFWKGRAQRGLNDVADATESVGKAIEKGAKAFTNFARDGAGTLIDVGKFAQKGVNLEGVQREMNNRLSRMFGAMPEHLREKARITSGFRPPEHQASILRRKFAEKGITNPTPAQMERGIPGRAAGVIIKNGQIVSSKSRHARGEAVDIHGPPQVMGWLHRNSEKFGIVNPTKIRKSDPVHFQLYGKATQVAEFKGKSTVDKSQQVVMVGGGEEPPPVPERGFTRSLNPDLPGRRFMATNQGKDPSRLPQEEIETAQLLPMTGGMPDLPERRPEDPAPRAVLPSGDSGRRLGKPSGIDTGSTPPLTGGGGPGTPGGLISQPNMNNRPPNFDPIAQRAFGGSFGELFARRDMGTGQMGGFGFNGMNQGPPSPVPLFRQVFGF